MQISYRITLDEPVIVLKQGKDSSYITIDKQSVVRQYECCSYALINGFKSKVGDLIPYVRNCDVSHDSSRILFYRESKKELLLFDVKAKKFLTSINNHKSGVESVVFNKEGSLFLTGGTEGRVNMWSALDGRRLDTFSHHSDAICLVCFSDDSRYVATVGYDKVIKVTNRSFRANRYMLIGHKEVPVGLFFIEGFLLISADRSGEVVIWDVLKQKVIHRFESFKSKITKLVLTQDHKFLFVCGITGAVALYDVAEKKLVSSSYVNTLSAIVDAFYDDKNERLVCGLADGDIVIYDLQASRILIESALNDEDYVQCYALIEDNPKLVYSQAYSELEERFDRYFQTAKKLLAKDEVQKATQLLQGFLRSASKRLVIQKLFSDFKAYARFKEAAIAKKYQLAYSLAEEYPSIKESEIFLKLEAYWEKLVNTAMSLEIDKEYEQKLRELFRPFNGVPGKSFVINTFIAHGSTLQLLRKMMQKKDYVGSFKLIQNNPYLKQMDEYNKLLDEGEKLEALMVSSFVGGEYYDAVKIADVLLLFPGKRERAEVIKEQANIYAETMSYLAEKKIPKVYDMIEQHPFLADAQIGKKLEEEFAAEMLLAEEAAATGDVQKIKEVMTPFTMIRSKIPSIAHVIALAYLSQIESAVKMHQKTVENMVKSYMEYFGFDEKLDDLLSQLYDDDSVLAINKSPARIYKGRIEPLPNHLG